MHDMYAFYARERKRSLFPALGQLYRLVAGVRTLKNILYASARTRACVRSEKLLVYFYFFILLLLYCTFWLKNTTPAKNKPTKTGHNAHI